MGRIMLEKNGKTLDFFPGEVSTDRIAAIQVSFLWLVTLLTINCIRNYDFCVVSFHNVQEAYWSMASVLSEADGIDYTDPEEVQISLYSCS